MAAVQEYVHQTYHPFMHDENDDPFRAPVCIDNGAATMEGAPKKRTRTSYECDYRTHKRAAFLASDQRVRVLLRGTN